ncbi:MAG: hypothetical protein K5927_00885 [Lachnospiraceae bacterium]|nr:hypothetical protein [Lachnospiraceae bacterium]
MECKNCGANYRLRELRCPHCETENLVGRIWLMRRTDTIKKIEEEQRAAKKRFVPYVASKLVNRLILLLIVATAVLIILYTGYTPWAKRVDGKIIDPKAEKLFEEKKYMDLEEYMSRKDLFLKMPEYYAQAALLAYDYNEFITERMKYINKDPDKWEVSYVQMVMSGTLDIYSHRVGTYSAEFEENKEQYEIYRRHIMAFWKGTMGCTDEEVAWLSNPENWWHSKELTEMCEELKNRRIKNAGAER